MNLAVRKSSFLFLGVVLGVDVILGVVLGVAGLLLLSVASSVEVDFLLLVDAVVDVLLLFLVDAAVVVVRVRIVGEVIWVDLLVNSFHIEVYALGKMCAKLTVHAHFIVHL